MKKYMNKLNIRRMTPAEEYLTESQYGTSTFQKQGTRLKDRRQDVTFAEAFFLVLAILAFAYLVIINIKYLY